MKVQTRRLLRLAQAQLQLSRLLEARILATRQELRQLQETQAGVRAAVDRAGPAGIVVYASAMRRLVDLDVAVADAGRRLKDMDRRLLVSRSRLDILMRRFTTLSAMEVRTSLESEAREGLFTAKARGKPGMVE